MNTKNLSKYTITISAVLLLALSAVGSVFAVHDLGLFELDRNAQDPGGAALPDDWATLYSGGGNADEFTGVIEDTTGSNPFGTIGTQFQAGGSKDDLDISPGGATGQYWKWEPGEPLDKDDITNAYAAAYVNTLDTGGNNVGDLIVYFGLDRFANNGSAQVGFWFLQDPSFGLTTIKDGGGYRFSGHHMVGDVLVQSNFTQGGVIDNISVFEWVGSGGSDGTLDLLFHAQDCATTGADDPACATVNQGNTPSPWLFTPKFGTTGTFPQGSFFEGGINITRLVPDAGCFTGFLAETRSSTPFDSRLKDFAFGSFELCSIAVTKTGDTLSKVGDDVDYTITVENTGALTLYKDEISDTLLGDLTNDAGCGVSLAPGATCTIDVTRTVQAGDPDPLPNTVTATYNDRSDFSGTAVSDSDDHSVNLFQPDISVEKECTDLSKIGDTVDCTVTITNDSSDDSPDLVFDAISDTVQGDLTDSNNYTSSTCGASFAWDESCTIEYSYNVPNDATDPYPNTVTVETHPDGFTNDIDAEASDSVNLFQPSIKLTKSSDVNLTKVGHDIVYTVLIENTSSSDTPDLVIESITDTLQGDLTDATNYDSSTCGATLASGASCTIMYTYTVMAGDPDPLKNTASVETHPTGFTNDIDASDDAEVNLFQPAIKLTKSSDVSLTKVGHDIVYTVLIENTSSSDTPDLVIESITDTLQGDLTDAANYDSSTCGATLASGASCTIVYTYTVMAGDPDPLKNTASVETHPTGFTNDIDASDDAEVNLFQPAIAVDKAGPQYSKAGDDVVYTITLSNNSSADTPAMNCTAEDTLLGTVFSGVLPLGDTVLHPSYTVQQGDPDPLLNTVTLTCSPEGFTNVYKQSASHSVDLIHPSFTVAKTCDAEPISYVGPALFTVDIANTGDVPLNITADDGIGSFTLAAGASQSFPVSVDGPFTPGGTADNTVTATWTLPELYGLSNTDTKTASDSCDVQQVVFETAYAMGDAPVCFTDLGANNWGWVNGDGTAYILPGTYTWDVWAGAAQCDTSKGTLVGTVTVVYDGTDVFVTFNIDPPYILGDTHVYAGTTQVPPGGFSPGQWQIYSPFNGEAIYIIVHAVVGIPQ